ncbi:MAG: hypothetical protein ACUVX9_05620 [Anaerolineae bacterium]
MAWHVYDVQFDGLERFTGGDYRVAHFTITKDEGVKTWQVRVRVSQSLRKMLGEQVSGLDDRDLAAGLGAQTILTLLENGVEAFEETIALDATHYPGRTGQPALLRDFRHLTVRAETTPEGEVIPPLGVSVSYPAVRPGRR